ncbi:MAG: hypothetical protein IJ065_05475 [Eubacterium sp.]|nr:hypothetical protein [Eubacterium sp.]
MLFEEFCINVVSCFSEYSLDILLDAGMISDTNRDSCILIRDLYITYENEFRACTNPEEIKSMKQWKEINDLADNEFLKAGIRLNVFFLLETIARKCGKQQKLKINED